MNSDRIWIATAPTGTWSSGPSVIYDEGTADPILDQYREMGWEVAGPYVLEPAPPRLLTGRTHAEVNEQRGERHRRQERMERIARDELSKDAQRGRMPFDHTDPWSGYPGEGEEPPDAIAGDDGGWPRGAPGRFPEPSQAQVDEAERKLAEVEQEPPDAVQALQSIARRGNGERNAHANWLDARDALRRWEAEGGALPREP